MSIKVIKQGKSIKGTVTIPGDKSISHRSIMLGAIARGTTTISHFLMGADCLATINCFKEMGVEISKKDRKIIVQGCGLRGLRQPSNVLDVGNSGTTTRLLSGLLVGQNFDSMLSGDDSLTSRPMKRIITPLSEMGGNITSVNGDDCAPLRISPGRLRGIDYYSPVASAQVKSAILLAGLYADSKTSVTEPILSRNHTEIMLKSFGCDVISEVEKDGSATAHILPCEDLMARDIYVPGDISSAAYFIAAALLIPGSELLVKDVGINDTRSGFLQVVQAMGGNISLLNKKKSAGEPMADILVRSSELKSTTISGPIIPTLIDEIPIIAVMAACASGTTVIKDAGELRVKETDRISTITTNLKEMGANIIPTDDGLIIEGNNKPLVGAKIDSKLDHRIAMAFTIAGLVASGETTILDSECVDVSFPNFFESIDRAE
ncbi:MAG: 3-phosphoshikimate 1-carboxyvinyltransferase [Suipraeoptans sp.]